MSVWDGRHQAVQHFEPLFNYQHLRPELQEISRPICELADLMVETIPDGPELSAGLRKLLEAKDCFVRSGLVRRERA